MVSTLAPNFLGSGTRFGSKNCQNGDRGKPCLCKIFGKVLIETRENTCIGDELSFSDV